MACTGENCIVCDDARKDNSFGKVWIKTSEVMPIAHRKYWVSDGKDVALAVWNIENMWWKFLYHYSVFKPIWMLPVKLPRLPTKGEVPRECKSLTLETS